MLRSLSQIVRHRALLFTLTQREIKARYRGSVLGFFWSLVNPLLLTAVYTLVFGVIFAGGELRGGAQGLYPLFLVAGLFPWIWVSSSLLEGAVSLTTHSALIRKAVFPVELPPLVVVLTHLVHFLYALPILLLALAGARMLGLQAGGWGMLLLPLVMVIQLPMVAGLTLGLAALNALFRDVKDLLANVLTLLFFLTPILYPLEQIPVLLLRRAILFNPFTPYTMAYQQVLVDGTVPGAWLWLQMLSISLVALACGAWLFARLRETLVELA